MQQQQQLYNSLHLFYIKCKLYLLMLTVAENRKYTHLWMDFELSTHKYSIICDINGVCTYVCIHHIALYSFPTSLCFFAHFLLVACMLVHPDSMTFLDRIYFTYLMQNINFQCASTVAYCLWQCVCDVCALQEIRIVLTPNRALVRMQIIYIDEIFPFQRWYRDRRTTTDPDAFKESFDFREVRWESFHPTNLYTIFLELSSFRTETGLRIDLFNKFSAINANETNK